MFQNCLNIGRFFYIRGNNSKEAISRTENLKGIWKVLRLKSIKLEYFISRFAVNATLTFVCGDDLFKLYKTPKNNVYKFVSTLIHDKDILKMPKKFSDREIINLIYVGRLVKYKGLEYLLKSFLDILENDTITDNIHLTIVGHGEYQERMKEFIICNRISNYITFLGYISDRDVLNTIYSNAHLLIIPSITEGTPKIVPESMAHGIPIIATNVGEMPFMVKNGVNGRIIEPMNSNELSLAILDVIHNKKKYNAMSLNALIRANCYTIEKQFDAMIKQIHLFFRK